MKMFFILVIFFSFNACADKNEINRDTPDKSEFDILNDRNYIVYRQKNNQNVVEIIDLRLGWSRPYNVEVLNKQQDEIAKINERLNMEEDVLGEWSIDFCKQEIFLCSKHGIRLAIPKSDIEGDWKYSNISCTLIDKKSKENNDIYNINCKSLGYINNLETTFKYSKERGVVSYKIDCDGCDGRHYELLSSKGLFAAE